MIAIVKDADIVGAGRHTVRVEPASLTPALNLSDATVLPCANSTGTFALPGDSDVDDKLTASQVIKSLALERHPEGGWYRQTWIEAVDPNSDVRPAGTCIYFLLGAGERSHWHRVDATEIWLFHAGAPLILSIAEDGEGPATEHLLTPDLNRGRPQLIVPKLHWQAARSTGEWTLVSCTVSPGFQFAGFELAARDFDIPLR